MKILLKIYSVGEHHLPRAAPTFTAIFIFIILLLITTLSLRAETVSRKDAIVKVVEKCSPAVVNINTKTVVKERFSPLLDFPRDPFFDEFFRELFEPYQAERVYQSLGSGVIIDPQGYILTNEHVIRRATEIRVTLSDQGEFDAVVVGADEGLDLAVLRIEGEGNLPAMKMGNSSDLMIGETVIAIGNPFGLSHTVTTGVISALNRSVKAEGKVYHNFIQTDASINPGNSGGPLLNILGELIAVNTAIYARPQGIGFAIPIDRAKRVVDELIAYGKIQPAWIGIQIQKLTPQLAEYFGYPGRKGVLITRVERGSPAEESGLKVGDILIKIEGEDIESESDYQALIKGYPPDENLTLEIYRGGISKKVPLKTGKFPLEMVETLAFDLLGIEVREKARGKVVVKRVREDSPAAKIGIRPGDLLLQIGEQKIESFGDFQQAVMKIIGRNYTIISIQRGEVIYRVSMRL